MATKPASVKTRVITGALNETKRIFNEMVDGIKNIEIKDNIFHVNKNLKTAWQQRDEIHQKVREEKIKIIRSSYEKAAEEFFLKTHKKEQESNKNQGQEKEQEHNENQKCQQEQERIRAIFQEVVNSYQTKDLTPSWPARKKLSELGLDTNSTSGLFATTQTALAIITYLKNAPSYQGKEKEFINQAYEFILAAHSTADCLNEYRHYKYDILQRAALAASLGGSAIATVLTINAEAILAGGFLAVLGGAATGGVLLAAALVIIAAAIIATALIQHEKKQLREDLTTTMSDGSEVGNVGSIMDKQREMRRQLPNYLNVEAAENNLFVNLSTVLKEVQKAEDDLVPTVELKK